MFKIPLGILIMLPKKTQENYIQKVWDNKSDEQIMTAYEDATGWLKLKKLSVKSIVDDCQMRLDKYILPQMEKRGLKGEDDAHHRRAAQTE